MMLAALLIACVSPGIPSGDCTFDACAAAGTSGGEYCCGDPPGHDDTGCWWRADGLEFKDRASFSEYCYDVDDGGSSGGFLLCNDGTRSPTCDSCNTGCCANHGGCR